MATAGGGGSIGGASTHGAAIFGKTVAGACTTGWCGAEVALPTPSTDVAVVHISTWASGQVHGVGFLQVSS